MKGPEGAGTTSAKVMLVAQTFVVNFYNNGPAPGTVILYQRKPENGTSLAWFAKYNYPQTPTHLAA